MKLLIEFGLFLYWLIVVMIIGIGIGCVSLFLVKVIVGVLFLLRRVLIVLNIMVFIFV